MGVHEYLLVASDYFTRWVEVTFYTKITSKHMAKFILNNITCRYSKPYELISNQGSYFKREVAAILKKYNIQRHKSSPYYPQANEAVKAANKNVCRLIKKMAENYKN